MILDHAGRLQVLVVDRVVLAYQRERHLMMEVHSLAAQHSVGILARVPLASGALSGQWTRQTRFPRDD
jgi:aryl-alcohol dehydrogenase-like predicted oxidoreductase